MNDAYMAPLSQLRRLAKELGYEISFVGPHIVLSKPRCKSMIRHDTPTGHTEAYQMLQRRKNEAIGRKIRKLERQLISIHGGK